MKFGAKVVRHGRYVTLQLAEIAIPRRLFAEILRLIDGLRPKAAPPSSPGPPHARRRPPRATPIPAALPVICTKLVQYCGNKRQVNGARVVSEAR